MWWVALTLWAGCDGDTGGGAPTDAPLRPALETWVPEDITPDTLQRVVFLGDSITGGWGASAPDLAYKHLLQRNVDDVWPEAADLDLERYGEPEVIDLSIGGATTETLRDGQLRALDDHLDREGRDGRTAVFMTVGGNDIQVALFSVLAGGEGAAEAVADGVEARLDDILAFLTDRGGLHPRVFVVVSKQILNGRNDVGALF